MDATKDEPAGPDAPSGAASDRFSLTAADGTVLAVQRWLPPGGSPRAVIQLEHGASEHSGRYAPRGRHPQRRRVRRLRR